MVKLLLLTIALAAIPGCATHSTSRPQPTTHGFTLTVVEDPSVVPKGFAGMADMKYRNGVIYECRVTLRKYPVCLAHEIRHCLEGDWHKGQERNTQDCN